MKYNYPIMYAVMPIETKNCRDGNPYTIYNIISKCYVLEERKEYTDYGEECIKYYVDFPFKNDCSIIFRKVYPDIRDALAVKKTYGSYEEALEEKEKCNAKLTIFSTFDTWDEYAEIMKEKRRYFHKLEELIEKNTPELHVGETPKMHKTIELRTNENKFYINSGSFYFNLLSLTGAYNKGSNFIIYSLSDEECDRLKSVLLENKKVDVTSFMRTPLMMGMEGVDIVKLVCPTGEKRDLCVNYYNCWYPEDNRFTKDKSFDESTQFDKVFFTNETYIDVLNSFNLNPEISTSIDLGYQRQMWSLHKL